VFRRMSVPGGRKRPPGNFFQRWLAFIIGVLLLAGLVFTAPVLERLPGLGPRIEALRESGVETGAFWWADVPEVSEAERYIRQSRDLAPGN